MSRAERQQFIRQIEEARSGRLLIAYITSTRSGHEITMADDVLRLMFDHLELGRAKAEKGVDLFIHSNGGAGTVPWRLTSLIREYTKNFAVLVPHRAFSAATLVAMGADEILMHKMGCLGPIDPSVANIFNPPHPYSPGQPAPISVEDVTAYFRMVKDEVGINHEDELIVALQALTEKIHPLALGNVQRSHNQSRMMARKLLKKHMSAEQAHEIDQIIDTLKSNLFFHGHPINRDEAKNDLNLKIEYPTADLETLMWSLYKEYESALKMDQPFSPQHELELRLTAQSQTAVTTADIVQQMVQMAQAGLGLGNVTEQQMVALATAMIPFIRGTQPPSNKANLDSIPGAYLESEGRTEIFLSDLSLERVTINSPSGPQEGLRQELRWQRWESEQ